MAAVAYQLTSQLSCHAWTADRLHLAICPNNHEIYVYQKSPTGQWTRTHTLSDHDQLVSGLDWSADSNQLVSCSHELCLLLAGSDFETRDGHHKAQ